MALAGPDLVEPIGSLTPELFPELDAAAFAARMTAYADDGNDRAGSLTGDDADAAARAWAHYRAYTAIATRLAGTASTVALADQGSRSYTDAQRSTFLAMAEASLAEFRLWVPADALTPTPVPFPAIRSLRRASA